MITYKNRRDQDNIVKRYKTFDNFREQLEAALNEIADEDIKESILKLSGLGRSEAIRTVEINENLIDKGLEKIIRYCVEHKIKTIASCSGLSSDHIYDEDREGYIALEDDEMARSFLERVWVETWPEPELSYSYFIPCIRIVMNQSLICQINNKLDAC